MRRYLHPTGLELARLADLPQDVLSEAWRVSKKMKDLESKRESDSTANQIAIRRKTMLRVISMLVLVVLCFLPGLSCSSGILSLLASNPVDSSP